MMFDVTLTVLSVVLSGASVSMDFMYTIQLDIDAGLWSKITC